MIKTIEALFDGKTIVPDEPLLLEANTHVRVTVETLPVSKQPVNSFLLTALALKLEGPADWSAQIEEYLEGKRYEPDNQLFSRHCSCNSSCLNNR